MSHESQSARVAALALQGGELPLGGGLLALVRPALDLLQPGGTLAVLSTAASVRHDLPAWCRIEHHEYLGCERLPDAAHDRHLIVRGPLGVPRGPIEPPGRLAAAPVPLTTAAFLAAVPFPASADTDSGFAPRGARLEAGRPAYPFTLLDRDHVAPPDVAALYDQAVVAQWDAARDIPWSTIRPLPPALEWAVGQVMTFLAENELSALYVPSRFVSRVHPAYVEVAMFLAMQMADESRHIDVFLKRARMGGAAVGISPSATARSLLSLLELEDFTEAEFLLSVLGEGTFLDLLRFIERFAPDEATAELTRRARADEARHVHFGMSHVRHALTHDATLFERLEDAVRRRAAALNGIGGVPAPVQDALTILAAGGDDPLSVARGHVAFRELLHDMHTGRVRRLLHAGFTASQAQRLSDLHTPNFM